MRHMPDNFSHVANSILRRTLEASPRQVKTEELRQALTMTAESLGYDVINDSMPSSVFFRAPSPQGRQWARSTSISECDARLRSADSGWCSQRIINFRPSSTDNYRSGVGHNAQIRGHWPYSMAAHGHGEVNRR